jgi:hypothetical protein
MPSIKYNQAFTITQQRLSSYPSNGYLPFFPPALQHKITRKKPKNHVIMRHEP